MIDKIITKNDCTGCFACSNICSQKSISMERNSEGFYYPKVNDKTCTKCSYCVRICPIINKIIVKNKPLAYACYNNNEAIRLMSSSGGLFTMLSELIIDQNGVVFGAGFDGNFSVIHSYCETKEELDDYRGSKYVQSKMGDNYFHVKEFLDRGRKVLFTGTPCQVGGLKSYLQKNYDNLFCIDNVCHGVPSPKIWEQYLRYQEEKAGSSISKISFRNKKHGWKKFSLSILFENNTQYSKGLDEDLFLISFMRNICLRASCYDCNYKTLHRQSDLTLADFWGVQNLIPDMDDDKGTSLVFVNNSRGQYLMDMIKDRISYVEVDINQAVIYNSAAVKSVGKDPKRKLFLKDADCLPFDKLVIKYCTDNVYMKLKRRAYRLLSKLKAR